MRTGILNRQITIQHLTTTTDASADATETWNTDAVVRASVEQMDGSRFMNVDELVDKAVYKIRLWDNSYGVNIRIVYGLLTLYPFKPPTVNPDRSGRDIMTIYATTKR